MTTNPEVLRLTRSDWNLIREYIDAKIADEQALSDPDVGPRRRLLAAEKAIDDHLRQSEKDSPKNLKPFAYCCAESGGRVEECDCVDKSHSVAAFKAVCVIPNCRNRAPNDQAFCSEHRQSEKGNGDAD